MMNDPNNFPNLYFRNAGGHQQKKTSVISNEMINNAIPAIEKYAGHIVIMIL